jgi:hypothetical protein
MGHSVDSHPGLIRGLQDPQLRLLRVSRPTRPSRLTALLCLRHAARAPPPLSPLSPHCHPEGLCSPESSSVSPTSQTVTQQVSARSAEPCRGSNILLMVSLPLAVSSSRPRAQGLMDGGLCHVCCSHLPLASRRRGRREGGRRLAQHGPATGLAFCPCKIWTNETMSMCPFHRQGN